MVLRKSVVFSVVAPVMQGCIDMSDHRPIQSVSQYSINLTAQSASLDLGFTMKDWSTWTFITGSSPVSSVGQKKNP